MKVSIGLDQSQKIIIVRLIEGDISSETSFVLRFYDDVTALALYSYGFSPSEIDLFKNNGVVYLLTDDVFTEYPSDGYYYSKVIASSDSEWTSTAFTLSIRSEVYSRISVMNVYSPDYKISELLHVCHMLLREIEEIPNLEYANQKKIDFDVRLAQLKEILSL